MQTYDAIIIGGGHNGLVTAAYLARAGKKTLVLERRQMVGGAAVTEEIYPGFKFTEFSYVVSLLRPEIIRELNLPAHGLHILPLESTFIPMLNGDYLAQWPDHDKNRREIYRHSPRDAEALDEYGLLMQRMAMAVKPILGLVAPDPTSLSPKDLLGLARAGKHFRGLDPKDFYNLYKLMTMSSADYLEEWFETEPLIATKSAGGIIGTFLGPRSPGMAGERSMRDYLIEGEDEAITDPLVFLAQPDSLLVSGEFASRNGLREGSRIVLATAVGNKSFTVRGIMQPRGMARAFGGNIAVMDIYWAQYVFGRGQIFDRIDVAIGEGLKIDEVQARIEAKLGGGFKVEPPARRGKQTESLLEAFGYGLFVSSVIALTIGLFLIFNAFAVSVTQRRTQIGILRALGVTRSQVQMLFLGESLVLGVLGSAAGIAAGMVMHPTPSRIGW